MLRIGYVSVTQRKDLEEEVRWHSPGGLAIVATTPVAGCDKYNVTISGVCLAFFKMLIHVQKFNHAI